MPPYLFKLSFSYLFWCLVFVQNAFGLKLATWNLENMMDFATFQNWQKECASAKQLSATSPEFKPTFLYCDAFSGKDFITNKPAYLALDGWEKFELKISALKLMEQKIKADIYAVQEVANKAALELIFNAEDYELFVSPGVFVQNIGFAVSKQAGFKVYFRVIDNLIPLIDHKYEYRPALELTLISPQISFRILNVHLKSGCKNYLIDEPLANKKKFKPGYNLEKACSVLKEQIILLKTWIKHNNNQQIPFLLMGDFNRLFLWEFNRFYRDAQPARLEGSPSLDPRADITPDTKLGLMFFEINSNEYGGNRLILSFPKRKVKKYLGRDRCLFGNDYIISNQRFLELSAIFESSLMIDSFESYAYDYGSANYGLDKALPSDHCILVTEFDL